MWWHCTCDLFQSLGVWVSFGSLSCQKTWEGGWNAGKGGIYLYGLAVHSTLKTQYPSMAFWSKCNGIWQWIGMDRDWQETRDRRWGYPCSQVGQPVLRMCKCAGIRSIRDALGLLSCFPSATFLEMVSHLQAHCRYGSTLHASAGKQLKLSQDVLNHLLDVCIFIYQMNIVHEGWNLLPLWNRAQPPGLFEPCHLRKLSGGSGKRYRCLQLHS